ncbi:MAG TPA: hypothetical protein VN843_14115 [Anaerolineales bacterium]|nr:hypothetical protein [Anaerolineales bacterium]
MILSIDRVRDILNSTFALEKKHEYLTVISVLDHFFRNIKIDKRLGKLLYHFQTGYISSSREYVEFFGSNLLGVHVIRFKESDVLRFFNEVLKIEYLDLLDHINRTDTVKNVLVRKDGARYKISGDIFNLTTMYLVHRCLGESSLEEKDRIWMAHNSALIFFYRAIAAILSAWFTYPSDPKIAQAAYANLSYKYLIKRLGSWHKVMDYRATELIEKNGTQYKKLLKLENDLDLVDVINDCANAIKDMLKNYYAEFDKVHTQGGKIGITQTTGFDVEGEEIIRSHVRHIDKSIALAKHYLMDQDAFIRDDYIRVISDINKNTSPRLIKETLLWISRHASGSDYKLIDDTVTSIIVYSFYLIETRIEPHRIKDISYVLLQLKNLYLSSRSTDEELMEIRRSCDKILVKAHSSISTPLLLATRTAIILYITFRVLVGQRKH